MTAPARLLPWVASFVSAEITTFVSVAIVIAARGGAVGESLGGGHTLLGGGRTLTGELQMLLRCDRLW